MMAAVDLVFMSDDSTLYFPGAGLESTLNSYFLPKSIPFNPSPNALTCLVSASGPGSAGLALNYGALITADCDLDKSDF